MLGRAGIIRLTEDAEVELGLGICEGIETGLAVMAAGWRPIWACSSLGALRRFPRPGRDRAPVDLQLIQSRMKSMALANVPGAGPRAGKEAQARIPNSDGDWNDLLLEEVL